jgi:1-deoxy-D-xylulose-5-phosphate synthase
MTVMAPKDENELQHMLRTALSLNGPAAVRYPRGDGYGVPLDQDLVPLPLGKGEIIRSGDAGALVAVGTMVRPALEAAETLAHEGISLTVVNARFIKPLDRELLLELAGRLPLMMTVEENALAGGFGSAVLELLEEEGVSGCNLRRLGYPDRYIEQGEQPQLRAMYGLDAAGIAASMRKALGR